MAPILRLLGFRSMNASYSNFFTGSTTRRRFAVSTADCTFSPVQKGDHHIKVAVVQENLARLLLLLDRISFFYPDILLAEHGILAQLVHQLLIKVYGEARVQILHCLSRCVLLEGSESSAEQHSFGVHFRVHLSVDMLSQVPCSHPCSFVHHQQLFGARDALAQVLKQQQLEVSLAALQLVRSLCQRRGAKSIIPLFGTLSDTFNHHKSTECRELYQQLLVIAHRELRDVEGGGGDTLRACLLQALSDPVERLREGALAYWHEEALPAKVSERMISCFSKLHAPTVEERWLHHCGVLLLRLSSSSDNYEKPLFDEQLRHGLHFDAYQIRPTEGSSSDAMLPWGSQSKAQDGSQYSTSGLVRATQQYFFSQTQSEVLGAAAGLSTYSSQGGADLFMPRAGRAERVPAFTDSAALQASSQPAEMIGRRFRPAGKVDFEAINAQRMRSSDASKAGRASTVVRYRTYRIGELPDIMITTKDLLAPLAALVSSRCLICPTSVLNKRTLRCVVAGAP